MEKKRSLVWRTTAAYWTEGNDVLRFGHFGFETDTGKLKLGDGITAWNDLDYLVGGDGGGGGASYLVYTALLNQTGTAAPVATVLENTIGFTPTFYYNDEGNFGANETFDDGTPVLISNAFFYQNTYQNRAQYKIEEGSLIIRSFNSGGDSANDQLVNAPIEIRVYQ